MRRFRVGYRGTMRTAFSAVCIAGIAAMLAGCPLNIIIPGGGGFVPGIAPGINVEVVSVDIPADLRPVVTLRITDNAGKPIDLSEITDARFILTYLETPAPGSTARYLAYTTRVAGGATLSTYDGARLNGLTQDEEGVFSYRAASAVPANYPRSSTHQLGGQLRRTSPIDGKNYVANVTHVFRPDGGVVTATREIVETETCNECHTRLAAHGGGLRREIQLCILCHSTQSRDGFSGNSLDMPEMIHKIHMGADLPSVQAGQPYQLFNGPTTINDFSDVQYPQDIRNCESCHASAAKQANVWMTTPTLAGCAACHDRTWFGAQDAMPAGYTMHVGGQQVNDSLCTLCHTPTAPGVSPIREAHLIPQESSAAPGLAFEITDITTTAVEQGTQLTVAFTAVDKNGAGIADPAQFNALGATVAYPASDYETFARENMLGSPRLVNNGGGAYTYTFNALLPAASDDTFAVALDGRREFTFRGQTYRQGTSTNARTYFTLDGTKAVQPRRSIVEDQKCNVCHKDLHFHGESRVGVDYCVMCHNPNTTDASRRPAGAMPPETVNFKDMIHHIHRGEDLENEYTAYGFGNIPHDYTEVRFPGRLEACSICHVDGSTDLPLPAEAISTVITQGGVVIHEELPERAACTSCHDSTPTEVHAIVNTDFGLGMESCAVCHGPGAAFAVDAVHELEP